MLSERHNFETLVFGLGLDLLTSTSRVSRLTRLTRLIIALAGPWTCTHLEVVRLSMVNSQCRPIAHMYIHYAYDQQGSAVADKPARRTASRRTGCKQTKVDAQCDKLATELRWQRFASKVANFQLPHLHLAHPLAQRDPVWVLPIKLESMGYRVTFAWSYI